MTPTTRKELVALMAEAAGEFMPLESDDPAKRALALAGAEASLTALEAADCRVVPAEATEEMIKEPRSIYAISDVAIKLIYTAMLARSPFAG